MSSPPTPPTQGQGYGPRDVSRETQLAEAPELSADERALLEAARAAGRYMSPAQARRECRRFIARSDARAERARIYGPPVLTAARRSGSVPVDRLGESIANQQSRRTA